MSWKCSGLRSPGARFSLGGLGAHLVVVACSAISEIRGGISRRCGRGARQELTWLSATTLWQKSGDDRYPVLGTKSYHKQLAARLQFRATGVPAPRAERDHNNLLGSAIYGARRLARRSVANSTGHIRADTLRFGRSLGAGVNIRYPRQPAVRRTDFR